MIRVGLALLFVLAFASNGSFASECEDNPVLQTQKRDGTKVGLFISKKQFDAAPVWSPSQGEPPISITQAYDLVMTWAKTAYDKFDGVEVREISMSFRQCAFYKSGWFYRFDLMPIVDGSVFMSSGQWAAVLMDGTIVAPREIEE